MAAKFRCSSHRSSSSSSGSCGVRQLKLISAAAARRSVAAGGFVLRPLQRQHCHKHQQQQQQQHQEQQQQQQQGQQQQQQKREDGGRAVRAAVEDVIKRTATSVAALGLGSGCLVFVDTGSGVEASIPQTELLTPCPQPPKEGKPQPAAGGGTSKTAGDANHRETERDGKGKRAGEASSFSSSSSSSGSSSGNSGSAFQPFDKFLKDRSYAVLDLPLANSYLPRTLKPGQMNKLPQTLTLKHQVYRHVDHLELMNVAEVQNFVAFWKDELNMQQQRCGFMLGYYREDAHYPLGIRAVCEAIYEPPQARPCCLAAASASAEGSTEGFRLLESHVPELEKVRAVAEALGLDLIGLIFTHKPREQFLTAQETIFLAKLQLKYLQSGHFTGYPAPKFVACTVALQSGGETPEEQQDISPNAFMVSDMVMALVRDGLVAEEQTDPAHIILRKPAKGELLPQVLEGGAERDRFDVHWAIVRVNESAPKKASAGPVRSIFQQTLFPRENRFIAQTPQDIRAYFNQPSVARGGSAAAGDSSRSNWTRFSDFHLLLYVANLFDLPTSLALCEAVAKEGQVDPGIEDVLKSLA
ncbi:hypothetical protein Esti_005980 [Eimeria stiedai]